MPKPTALQALQAKFDKLQAQFTTRGKEMLTMKGQLGNLKAGLGPERTLEAFETDNLDLLNNNINKVSQLTKAVSELSKAGQNFKERAALEAGLGSAIDQIDRLLGSAKLGAKSYEELTKGLQSFARMAKLSGDGVKNLTANLAAHQAVMSLAGVSMSTFQQTVDTSTFSLKQNADQVESMNLRLAKFASDSGLHANTVSRNFNFLAKNLMIDSKNIERELTRAHRVEEKTGVTVSRQHSSLKGVTTDFAAASTMAGNLNSLMEGNKLSASGLFMALTPGEVLKQITDAFEGTKLEKAIQYTGSDRNQLKSRQLGIKALADNTNFTPDEIRRIFDPSRKGSLQSKIGKQVDKDLAGVDIAPALNNTGTALQTFTATILAAQRTVESEYDRMARMNIIDRMPDSVQFGQRQRERLESGPLPDGFDRSRMASLGAGRRSVIERLNKRRQIAHSPLKMVDVADLMRRIASPNRGTSTKAIREANDLINSGLAPTGLKDNTFTSLTAKRIMPEASTIGAGMFRLMRAKIDETELRKALGLDSDAAITQESFRAYELRERAKAKAPAGQRTPTRKPSSAPNAPIGKQTSNTPNNYRVTPIQLMLTNGKVFAEGILDIAMNA